MDYLIIIPAYNVEKDVLPVLNGLKQYKNNVLFIDDGSEDNTYKVIIEYGYRIIRNRINLGVTFSILKGLEYAKENNYKKIILMDADGQHDPKHIPEIIEKLNYCDFVFCNRFNKNNPIPSLKWNSNMFGSMIVNEICQTNFFDISCGFKAFKLDEEILEKFKYSSGYQIVFDIVFIALKRKSKIGIVQIEAIYDNSKFLSTRKEELEAFLNALKKYSLVTFCQMKLDIIYDRIKNHEDFTYKVKNVTFYAFYLKCKETYILQSDWKELNEYIDYLIESKHE